MAAPARRDLKFVKSDDYRHLIRFEENGSGVDVSDATFKSQIRTKLNDDNLVAEFVIDSSDATNGNIFLTLDENVTTEIDSGKYEWDIEIYTTEGKRTFLSGSIEVLGEVTL